MKEYLVAVDLEGIHGIVGEPYKTLSAACDYKLACENAVIETNTVVKALFDNGADAVTVWDNHGQWNNMDVSKLDPRVTVINATTGKQAERIFFAREHSYVGMLCIGYHSKEGTVRGVLAHTFDSVGVQYFKINGETVGELEVDAYCAGEYGFPLILFSSDEQGCKQAREFIPGIRTVITKYGKNRNTAELLPEEEVLAKLYEETALAMKADIAPKKLALPAKFEKRLTRSESAEACLERYLAKGIEARYGEDSHTVSVTLEDINDALI